MLRTPQPGAQFVQLEVREPEMAEGALVERLSVLARANQPGGDGGLTVDEDPLLGGSVQPFGQRRQYPCDLLRRGFQPVQWGVASGIERGAAGLAAKGLDRFSVTMLAIPNQGMDRTSVIPKY